MGSALRVPIIPMTIFSFPASVPGPPGAIKAVVRSGNSIVVSWLPPELSNGIVQRYHIYVR